MKDDKNFGRRVVRTITEGAVLFFISVMLVVTLSLHNDLPIGELSFPLLTSIASVMFMGQYITWFLRYMAHIDVVNRHTPIAYGIGWMLSEGGQKPSQLSGHGGEMMGWKKALSVVKEGSQGYVMAKELEQYSRVWFLRQFDPRHIWKYRNRVLVYRVLIDMLRLPVATLFWILGILGVIAGFVHLFALWFVTFAWLYYHHIMKSAIAFAEANGLLLLTYDASCLQRLLLMNWIESMTSWQERMNSMTL